MQLAAFHHTALRSFLKNLSNQYQISIHIGGLMEYAESDSQLLQILSDYIIHQNPYCMFVKGNASLWNRCICLKGDIIKALERTGGPIFGTCHCGIAEYIVPVIRKGKVAGYLSAGYFRPEEQVLRKRLRKTADRYGFDLGELSQIYRDNIPDQQQIPAELIAAMGTLSLLFSSLADDMQLWNSELTSARSQHQLLMQQAVEYLHLRYGRDVSLDSLAKFCNCSISFLQHLFKQYYGVTVSAYLESIRMEKARFLLKNSELPVKQIAMRVGYHDANYFSTVFAKNHKLSPTSYRKQRENPS
ncbi:MAG: helix-turn-helix domain-containing protein [Candidatus Merdivicinus sp.]|jgi:AraC-like DNA-binding protein/ligand-binding sensor protein